MEKNKIFFIGIGGKGINGIAKICHEKGYEVSGVDTRKSAETLKLESMGVKVYYEHSEKNIQKGTQFVIRTSVVNSCPEIDFARKNGIPVIKRSEFLKIITESNFKICIAGSHGKSTTTAIAGLSLLNNKLSPTIYGGAYIKEIDDYNHLGESKMAVIEACEYDRSFFDLIGNATIIIRAEKSHLEYYKDEREMVDAFKEFVHRHDEKSLIVINGDDDNLVNCVTGAKAKIISFGLSEFNDYQIVDLKLLKDRTIFSLVHNSPNSRLLVKDVVIKIPGVFNALNFSAVMVLFDQLNIPLTGIFETARNFSGIGRRFEVLQTEEGATLIDDYAHHPTQVKNLLDGIRQFYPDKKVCAVFQPRQYNLIKNFIREYGMSFSKSDEVIVTDIVPALGDTESDIRSLKPKDVLNSISVYSNRPVTHKNNFQEIAEYIKGKYKNDVVVAMIGAGNINEIRQFFKIKIV